MSILRPVEIKRREDPVSIYVTEAVACTECPAVSEMQRYDNEYLMVEFPSLTAGLCIRYPHPKLAMNHTLRTLRPGSKLINRES